MFNYTKRIFLSGFITIIVVLSLFLQSYRNDFQRNNYQFICLIGSMSEVAPDKLDDLIHYMDTDRNSHELYKKGDQALTALGYGPKGRNFFNSHVLNKSPYFFHTLLIISLILLLQYYISRPIKDMKNIIHTLIDDIERAMTKYPIKLETYEVNIPLLNRLMGVITSVINQLNHQIELLEMAQKDRTIFIENISHQIKTPLTCISLDLELLENVTDTSNIQLYTDSCYAQIEHIEALINRLLKIGKLESGMIHYEFLEHNLIDTVSVLCNTLDGKYPDKKVTLSYDPSMEYIISYDFVWLYEALENIIKNCYLYSYDNEGIEITITRHESYIKIVLCDHGIGIPTEDLPNIFNRFYRSKQNQNQEGFGIGLNLAKLVIEDHHGTILAHSDSHSTEFIIHLPIIV